MPGPVTVLVLLSPGFISARFRGFAVSPDAKSCGPHREESVQIPETPKHLKSPLARFKLAKALATFERRWLDCTHAECRKRRLCCGGPRGTCRKTGGVTFCGRVGEMEPETGKDDEDTDCSN